MREEWDLYDRNGAKLNKSVYRDEADVKIQKGEYHIVAMIYTFTRDGKALITQRDKNKTFPLKWEVSGGSVLKGESVLAGAVRELREETGIAKKECDLFPICTYVGREYTIFHEFCAIVDDENVRVTLQDGETVDYRFIPYSMFKKFVDDPECAAPITERFHENEAKFDAWYENLCARADVVKQIKAYSPKNEQEERDKPLILDALRHTDNIFLRTNETMHMTASAWVVNRDGTRALMVYHNIYDSWSWLGGHADGDCDLPKVALREVCEESGLRSAKAVTGDILSLEILTVDGHEKRGRYVPSHLHLNVTYLIEADDREPLSIKADENSGVKWFTLDGAIAASSEPWFCERIYSKLNAAVRGKYGI